MYSFSKYNFLLYIHILIWWMLVWVYACMYFTAAFTVFVFLFIPTDSCTVECALLVGHWHNFSHVCIDVRYYLLKFNLQLAFKIINNSLNSMVKMQTCSNMAALDTAILFLKICNRQHKFLFCSYTVWVIKNTSKFFIITSTILDQFW